MRMKFLSHLQIPSTWWCLQLMRAHHTVAAEERQSDPIKLIKSDGHVSVYHRPVDVAEVMSEFPKHLVCHSDSFYIGQKIPALSEHDQLQLGQKYFLLPSHFFQSVLSFVTIASFVSSQPAAAPLSGVAKKAAAHHQLFDVQKTASGGLRIRVSDEFISQLMEEGRKGAATAAKVEDYEDAAAAPGGACGVRSRVCSTAQLERDYEQLVVGSRERRWKPKLEVIKERSEKKKGLIAKSFGIKRRKSSSQSHHLRSDCSSSKKSPASSKSRLRMKSRKLRLITSNFFP